MTPIAAYVDTVESDLHEGPAALTEAGFDVRRGVARSRDELLAVATGVEALLVGDSPVDGPAIDGLESLRIIAAVTVGTDHIDLDAARRRGIWVTNVPDATTEEVAVHAVAMALALIRHLPFFDRHVRDGGWDWRATGPLRRPSGLTLGIVGLGRIGRRVATVGGSVFGTVLGTDPTPGEWPAAVERTSLDDLLARADVVTLHLPLTAGTALLLDRHRIAAMRPGAFVVNVSRGGLIDADALMEALDDGRLAGAAVDVLAAEPPPAGDRLATHPRVLATPHVAFLSHEGERASVDRQAANVIAWHRTGRPLTPVVEGGSS